MTKLIRSKPPAPAPQALSRGNRHAIERAWKVFSPSFFKHFLPAGLLISAAIAVNAEQANPEIEEVVVTGSYIRGPATDAPSPVQILKREEIVGSGVSDTAELIRNLEIASGSDTAPTDGTRFNGGAGAGLANVNLRGLGPTSTLVLLDGKRMTNVGQKLSDGDRFVDINSIPITMIKRVEVLKNGASATYGSDAIAGVTNFITRDDFEGFEITAKHQGVTTGNQNDSTLGAIFGWTSNDSRTHFVIGGEWFARGELEAKERLDLRRDRYNKQGAAIVNRFTFTGSDKACESSTMGFYNNNAEASDPNVCNRPGYLTGVIVPEQKRQSILANLNHSFSDRLEGYAQISYMNGRSGSARPVNAGPIEPKYFFPSLLASTSGKPFSKNPLTGGAPNDPSTLPNGGPLPAAATANIPLPLELADFQLRVPGIDPQRKHDSHNNSKTIRAQLGVKGDFEWGEKPWFFDASITHGQNKFATHGLGIDKNRLELAMYGLGGPSCKPNGSIAPQDPRAAQARYLLAGADGKFDAQATTKGAQGPLEATMQSLMGNVPGFPFINPDNLVLAMTSTNSGDHKQGCYFYNPLLTRQSNDKLKNSDELLRWIEKPMRYQLTTAKTSVFDFVMGGELFEFNGSMADIAVGVQYRRESRKTEVNPQITGSVNSFGQQTGGESVGGLSENKNFDADRNIYGIFGELALPINDDLDLQLAARFEDYGKGIGSTFNPKLALRWQTTDSWVLRGGVASSFRGPALAQINEGTGFSLEFGVKDQLGSKNNAAGKECVRTGRCDLPTGTDIPTIIIVKQGKPSPDLKPEKAVTWNFGAIWTAQSGRLEGMTIGADYYFIDFKDKIVDVPTQAFLKEELALFNKAKAAKDFVIVNATLADFGKSCDPSQSKYDVGGNAAEACQVNPKAYAITGTKSKFGGNITRRADTSRSLQIIASNAINTGKIRTSGVDLNIAYPFSTDFGQLFLAGSLNWIHQFKVSDFPVGQPDFDAAGYSNRDPNRRLTRSMPRVKARGSVTWMSANHSARLGARVVGPYKDNAALRLEDETDTYFAIDLSYTYNRPIGEQNNMEITVGAIDLFDADLPKVRSASGVDLTVFDQRGRRVYLSATYRM